MTGGISGMTIQATEDYLLRGSTISITTEGMAGEIWDCPKMEIFGLWKKFGRDSNPKKERDCLHPIQLSEENNMEKIDQCTHCDNAVEIIRRAYGTATPEFQKSKSTQTRSQLKEKLGCRNCTRTSLIAVPIVNNSK